MLTADAAIGPLWEQAMGPGEPMPTVRTSGPDEYLPSVFPVTTAATAAIGVSSAAAARLLQLRNQRHTQHQENAQRHQCDMFHLDSLVR